MHVTACGFCKCNTEELQLWRQRLLLWRDTCERRFNFFSVLIINTGVLNKLPKKKNKADKVSRFVFSRSLASFVEGGGAMSTETKQPEAWPNTEEPELQKEEEVSDITSWSHIMQP